MLLFVGLLNDYDSTRLTLGDFWVSGGSGRSQVGGIPALAGS